MLATCADAQESFPAFEERRFTWSNVFHGHCSPRGELIVITNVDDPDRRDSSVAGKGR